MIERLAHRIWLGDDEPDWTRPYADTWRRPGWSLRQWSGPEELYPLRNQAIYDAADRIAPNHAGQLRSDVLRYEILLRYGGVYVDHDVELLKPIDELLDVQAFAAWEVPASWINQAVLGAVPGHPLLEALVAGLPESLERAGRRRLRPAVLSGPQFLTRTVNRDGPFDLTVYPKAWFYPYLWSEIDRHGPDHLELWPDSYAVHHWHNRRREAALA
jgi:mannosyltransferase OCH1-like enzyme